MQFKEFGDILDGQKYRDREAVYGLLYDESGQIAIINTPRGYFLPGGGIEKDESHQICIQREFLEETGCGIEVGEYIGCGILYGFAPSLETYLKMIEYFYKVSLSGEEQEKKEDDHEMIWIDICEAEKSMLLEHQSWAISASKPYT